jgi:hypothetical protein
LAPTWLATWVLVTLAVLAVLPIPLLVLAGRADPQAADSAIGWGPFVLAALHRRAGGQPGTRTVAAEVNLLLLFLLAALLAGALLYAWRRWRRM